MIRILHHHLRRGGVTRVIASTAKILMDAGHAVEIWSGEAPAEPLPDDLQAMVVDELVYADEFSETVCDALVEKVVQAHADGDCWHIHNHSLGKSPVVTEAVGRLALRGIPMVLQLHDFAEDGRPKNFKNLQEQLPEGVGGLYPLGPHVRYAVLQNRDQHVLTAAGIPEEAVHLLPNPVPLRHMDLLHSKPVYKVLYLTRGIRRKNIGEFLYWAKGLQGSMAFSTSLVPENPAEFPVFNRWKEFAREQGVEVQWGLGLTGIGLSDLIDAHDLCITTSVAEGFGMSFLEPYAMGIPVVGRDLPEITEDFKRCGVHLEHLYSALPVPLSDLDAQFWKRAVSGVNAWRQAMGIEQQVNETELRDCWVKDNQIDFGRLDEPAQQSVIRQLPAGSLSPDPLVGEAWDGLELNRAVISGAYNALASLNRLEKIYGDLERGETATFVSAGKVRDAFADVGGISLLRI